MASDHLQPATHRHERRYREAVDLFAGCGGLTCGLRQAGFRVRAAVDVDPLAMAAYRMNHRRVATWLQDITAIRSTEIMAKCGWKKGQVDLVAGCPPCQGFSNLRTLNGARTVEDPRNDLIREFSRLVLGFRPKAVLMENVPGLAKDERLEHLENKLRRAGYVVHWRILNAADFGVPQRRRRLILTAGLSGQIPFPKPSKQRLFVRDAIESLQPAESSGDPAHDHSESRSEKVRRMIQKIPRDGGGRSSLPEDQQLLCHQFSDGFRDVYGRMAWSDVAPTITSGFINPSKGRFLHPEEDRAITIREGANLQTFPADYRFPMDAGKYAVATLIGNAVPPAFAREQGRAIIHFLKQSEDRL